MSKFWNALLVGLAVCGGVLGYYTPGIGQYVAEFHPDKSSISVRNLSNFYYMYADCSVWFEIDGGAEGQGYDSIIDVPDEEVRNILNGMAHDFVPYCVAE